MKGRLTNITNVDSKDQRFLDKLNKVKFYNHKLYFTTVTNLPLKEGYGYQILGRFEKAYTSKGVYDSFKIEAILNDDFSFETIRNLLTMGSVNKKLADKYGMQCWTNAESFDRDMPIDFLPIKFDKLRMKLEAAKRAGYDKAITFEFSHFMSPQSAYLQAGHLYDRYKRILFESDFS